MISGGVGIFYYTFAGVSSGIVKFVLQCDIELKEVHQFCTWEIGKMYRYDPLILLHIFLVFICPGTMRDGNVSRGEHIKINKYVYCGDENNSLVVLALGDQHMI